MKIGDKVTYREGKKEKTGKIHGIRKSENGDGNERIVGYVVDTGKVDYEEQLYDADGKKTGKFVQPVFADVSLEDIKLA